MLPVFLSTLSLRRATIRALRSARDQPNFYPRSPCGERHPPLHARCRAADISIHALLAESDANTTPADQPEQKFLSTLSLRRATKGIYHGLRVEMISIHALLAESDIAVTIHYAAFQHFYPRSPCGERPGAMLTGIAAPLISIHALLAESDPCSF